MGHSLNYLNGRNHSYLEQFCAIGASGFLGVVAMVAYSNGHTYVAWSGIAILSLAVLRSLLLLLSLAYHGYHRSEQGFNPWRYVILSFPIVLYFFGPPISSAKSDSLVLAPERNLLYVSCEDLENWAKDESKRDWSEGHTVVVIGYLVSTKSGRTFRFINPREDHDTLGATVVSEEEIVDVKSGRAQVTAELRYRKHRITNQYGPILKVRSRDDIIPIERGDP